MHVTIYSNKLGSSSVDITDTAAKLVRMNFNPSTLPDVDRVKAIAAAFISECERIIENNKDNPIAAREAAEARTCMQTGSMFAVAAITSKL